MSYCFASFLKSPIPFKCCYFFINSTASFFICKCNHTSTPHSHRHCPLALHAPTSNPVPVFTYYNHRPSTKHTDNLLLALKTCASNATSLNNEAFKSLPGNRPTLRTAPIVLHTPHPAFQNHALYLAPQSHNTQTRHTPTQPIRLIHTPHATLTDSSRPLHHALDSFPLSLMQLRSLQNPSPPHTPDLALMPLTSYHTPE